VNDAAYDPPVIDSASPTATPWQQRFNKAPLFIAQPEKLLPNQGRLPIGGLESQFERVENRY
jgi:hypothetical protein